MFALALVDDSDVLIIKPEVVVGLHFPTVNRASWREKLVTRKHAENAQPEAIQGSDADGDRNRGFWPVLLIQDGKCGGNERKVGEAMEAYE